MDGVILGWRERWSEACRDVGGMEGRIIISMMERERGIEGCRD